MPSGPVNVKGCRTFRASFTTTTVAPSTHPSRSPSGSPEAGIDASIGTTGDSYDNALAETINGLYKTELIKPRGPWRTVEQVEVATLEWVDWFNHRRLYEHNGDIPPVELEQAYYAQNRAQQSAEPSNQ